MKLLLIALEILLPIPTLPPVRERGRGGGEDATPPPGRRVLKVCWLYCEAPVDFCAVTLFGVALLLLWLRDRLRRCCPPLAAGAVFGFRLRLVERDRFLAGVGVLLTGFDFAVRAGDFDACLFAGEDFFLLLLLCERP